MSQAEEKFELKADPPGKYCRRCGKTKPFELFSLVYSKKAGRRKRFSWCKKCNADYSSNLQKANIERTALTRRKTRLKCNYRLTPKQFDAMWQSQMQLCGICNKKLELCSKTNRKGAVVDHCHKSGMVREILCSDCNIGLGMFHDDPAVLASAIAYLAKHAQPKETP